MLGSFPVIVTLPAVELSRAKKFYSEILGLSSVDIGDNNDDVAIFEAGNGTQIAIYQREATKAEHTTATFMVKDVEKVVDGLSEKGVVFEQYDIGELKTDARGIANLGDFKGGWFKDTEGNIIALMTM